MKRSLATLLLIPAVTVLVSEATLAVQLGDGDLRVIRRTTTQPVRSIKGRRPLRAVRRADRH